jgi:hypothetical protein
MKMALLQSTTLEENGGPGEIRLFLSSSVDIDLTVVLGRK